MLPIDTFNDTMRKQASKLSKYLNLLVKHYKIQFEFKKHLNISKQIRRLGMYCFEEIFNPDQSDSKECITETDFALKLAPIVQRQLVLI